MFHNKRWKQYVNGSVTKGCLNKISNTEQQVDQVCCKLRDNGQILENGTGQCLIHKVKKKKKKKKTM